MIKIRGAVILCILIVVFGFISTSCLSEQKMVINEVCINEVCFDVEVAQTAKEVEVGLMHRQSMPNNHGMLFVFPKQKARTFWMKNTLIPLDMIWIDGNKQVVGVLRNALPCQQDPCKRYYSYRPAQYVLEINGGLAAKYSIDRGQTVVIK